MSRFALVLFSLSAVVGCTPPTTCEPVTCASLGKNCGTVIDGCGAFLDCGLCVTGQSCGGAGTPNVCGVGACTPSTCASLGATCGAPSDGCDGVLNCGACGAGQTCNATNQCACIPKTCASQGFTCGSSSDGCGGTLDCGICGGGQTCTGNVCGCVPRTCATAGAGCGSVSNGCGGTLSCGACSGTSTCGGAGTPNQCGCTPKTCATAGANCGSVSDGCGGTLACGSCAAPLACGTTASVCAAPASAKICEGAWCWEDPVPQGHELVGLSMLASNDVWAVATTGGALHFDGTQWNFSATGVNASSIYAADATHVFVVGESGTIAFFNGTTWAPMTSPTTQYLASVSGTSATDVWAVGAAGTILHYNGTSWSTQTSGTTKRLVTVHARSATDVWVGGASVVLKGNGTTWASQVVSGANTNATYTAIWALSATDVFLGDDTGALFRMTASSFTKNTFAATYPITGLYGTSPSTMFAVAGDKSSNNNKLLKFNGTSWSLQSSTMAVRGTLLRLQGVSATDLWAVGETGALAHFDGTSWSFKAASVISDIIQTGASMGAEDLAVATSYAFYTRSNGGFIRRQTTLEMQAMHDAWANSPTDVWFVGERSGPGFTWYGKAAHWNGTTITDDPLPLSPTTTVLRGVCSTGANAVWVVGDGGKILRYNGVGWANVASPTTLGLTGIWCKGSSIFVVGEGSTMLKWNGSAFVAMTPPAGNTTWLSVSGTSDSDVWASGRGGRLAHWDGSTWTIVTNPADSLSDIDRVLAISATEAWALDGALMKWDGTSWTRQPGGPGHLLVLTGSPTKVWITGWDGVMAK